MGYQNVLSSLTLIFISLKAHQVPVLVIIINNDDNDAINECKTSYNKMLKDAMEVIRVSGRGRD